MNSLPPPPNTVEFPNKSLVYNVALCLPGDIDDEEEVLDWLTDPENMELTDHIERVNRKMFQKVQMNSDYLAVFFCKYFHVTFDSIVAKMIVGLCRQQGLPTMSTSVARIGTYR